ncbi:MAG: SWIM zinc finger family protein [Magnetococcales bacterium]|nr:SWIM zinc finger family protein [Magnetococcales bacterium]
MKEIKFIAQASRDEPAFMVTIVKEESNLTARCTCPEGGVGHICRHRLSILSGDDQMVISDNAAELRVVEAWVVWSDIGILIARLAQAQWRLQQVKQDAERSANSFDTAYEEVRTIKRLLVQAIND